MSIYNYETSLRLKTRWDILDFILEELSLHGQNICNKPPPTENEFYTIHIDLICEHDITRFKQTIAQLTKPFYPYIIFTYYILFHGQNLKTAYELYQMILESYHRNSREFNEDELSAFEMLREVIGTFKALSEQRKEQEKNNLPSHMTVLATKLKYIKCPEYGWSCLFKNLLLSWIDIHNEEILENLEKAEKVGEESFNILDKEIIEHYSILDRDWESPLYKFFSYISAKILKKMEKTIQRIYDLKKKRESYEKKLNKLKIEKIMEKVEKYIYVYIIISILTLNFYFKHKIKMIDEEIKNLRFEDLEKIIWG